MQTTCLLCDAERIARTNSCAKHRNWEWQKFLPGYAGRRDGNNRACLAFWRAGLFLTEKGLAATPAKKNNKVKRDRLYAFDSRRDCYSIAIVSADLDANLRYSIPIDRLRREFSPRLETVEVALHAVLIMTPPNGQFHAYNMTRYRDLAPKKMILPEPFRAIELDHPVLQFAGNDPATLTFEAVERQRPLRSISKRSAIQSAKDAEAIYDGITEGICNGE